VCNLRGTLLRRCARNGFRDAFEEMQQRLPALYQLDVRRLPTLALVSDHVAANACTQARSVFHIDARDLISPVCVTIAGAASNGHVTRARKSHALIKYRALETPGY